ncbi:MAG TPA: hypothetical protein VK400_18170 [Pyrinomonadaceae bacterium]|nr:hypothetical protein [Pyrinomonadaceae bacterium]
MNNFPRQVLRQILSKYGREICSDARRCEGLLNDLCGAYRREINVLVNAVEERVPLDLLAGAGSIPPQLLLAKLEKRLEDQTALTAEAAGWAVESWALALGVTTEAEIEKRRQKQPGTAAPAKAGTIAPPESRDKAANRDVSNINQPSPQQSSETQAPVPQSKNTPSAKRLPAKIPPVSPPAYSPQNNQPPAQAQSVNPHPQPVNPAKVRKSPFRLFRGCLIIVFLFAVVSVALMFGVPYVVKVMRETQSERNDEPPRFPAR